MPVSAGRTRCRARKRTRRFAAQPDRVHRGPYRQIHGRESRIRAGLPQSNPSCRVAGPIRPFGVYSLNSTSITLVRIALWKKYGHNVSFQGGDSEWVQVPAPTIPAALSSDQIDAGTLIHAQAYKAMKRGEFRSASAFLAVWAACGSQVPDYLLPGPWEVARDVRAFVTDIHSLRHMAVSIGHIFAALAAAFVLGAALAFLAHYIPVFVHTAGEGPVVFLLHGIGGNRTNRHDQLPSFADRGFCAVSWDARGYGLSDDYDGPLDFADFSHDLARLLDHLDVGRAHLVRLSMGGRILQDFYPRYPDRVATLVTIGLIRAQSTGPTCVY